MKIKICFLIETSCKMTPYLYDVQCSMDEVINQTRFYHPHADILIAAVMYHDTRGAAEISSKNWTPDNTFWDEWENLQDESRTAWYNEKVTEDVASAVNFARVGLNWMDADTRAVYHYGISPAHGKRFLDSEFNRYPDGNPNGKDLLADMHMFSWFCDYTFFRINPLVDTMLSLMHEVYTGGNTFTVTDLMIIDACISEPDSEEE